MVVGMVMYGLFFFSSRRRHTRWTGDWSSDVCSSDLWEQIQPVASAATEGPASQPFTLVIEIDAWDIRERDNWGKTKERSEERRVGKECRYRWSPDDKKKNIN